METQEYSCDIHAKTMETRMCDIHTKIKERAGFLCHIHTKKSRTVLLRKEAKRCGSPHKIRLMYEIKGNNKEVYS